LAGAGVAAAALAAFPLALATGCFEDGLATLAAAALA
jgi:hypothetical protein